MGVAVAAPAPAAKSDANAAERRERRKREVWLFIVSGNRKLEAISWRRAN